MAVDIRDTRDTLGTDAALPPATALPPSTQPQRETKTSAEVVSSGSMGEAIGGIAAAVLAIIGLAGLYSGWLAPISVIVLGGAFILHGGSVASRYYELLDETGRTSADEMEMGGGMGAEILGGAAGVILGVLGLLGLFPVTLTAVAVIVLGGTMLLACGANDRLNAMHCRRTWYAHRDATQRMVADVVMAANGTQALVGLGAIILGIVALVNPYYPLTLALVGVLALACSQLLSGGALAARMMTLMNRR